MTAVPTAQPRLVGMMAAHLSSTDQLSELSLCLESLRRQSSKPSIVVVSYSAGSARLATAAAVAFADAGSDFIVALHSKVARSQFEHYTVCAQHVEKALVDDSCTREDVWCLFSDDDDLWHPERCFRC